MKRKCRTERYSHGHRIERIPEWPLTTEQHTQCSQSRERRSEHTLRSYCIALWSNCASWRECEKQYFINVWQGFFLMLNIDLPYDPYFHS